MKKTCLTCRLEKPLTDYWLAPESGRAKVTPPARHCIKCHAEGRVAGGYGPGCRWQSPADCQSWLDGLADQIRRFGYCRRTAVFSASRGIKTLYFRVVNDVDDASILPLAL